YYFKMEIFSLRSTAQNVSIGLSLIKFEFQKLKRIHTYT
ncbi:MAG: hypothetical protein ACI90V_004347, partial [Bacillariaceae sp.]